MPEHAVLITMPLLDERFGTPDEREAIHELCDELEEAVAEASAGEFDGDEFGEGECTLYLYGPDADRLFAAVEPLLRQSPVCRGARVVKRYGEASDPDAPEVTLEL